jgi:DNA-binding NtrC family response regulator
METSVKHKKKVFVQPRKSAISIFLVDDDLAYLYPLGFYLQKNTDHMVYCYRSGEECIANLYKAPDVIILDYNLNPEEPNAMNGLNVLQEVKGAMPKAKVVMLSGRETFSGVVESLKLGAYTYVIKDIEALATLKKIIEKIAEEKPTEE